MASTPRIPVASSRSRSLPKLIYNYTCLRCQSRAIFSVHQPLRSGRPSSHSQPRRFKSSDGWEGSFSQKLQRKLLGKDIPPGQRNPDIVENEYEREQRLLEEEEKKLTEEELEDIKQLGSTNAEDELENRDVEEIETEENEELDEGGREEQLPKEYEPATTWRQLRHISDEKVIERAIKPWYKGFMSPVKMKSRADIARAVQLAVVEVWALKEAGESLATPKDGGIFQEDVSPRVATGSHFKATGSGTYGLEFTDPRLQEEATRLISRRGLNSSDGSAAPSRKDSEDALLQVDEKDLIGKQIHSFDSAVSDSGEAKLDENTTELPSLAEMEETGASDSAEAFPKKDVTEIEEIRASDSGEPSLEGNATELPSLTEMERTSLNEPEVATGAAGGAVEQNSYAASEQNSAADTSWREVTLDDPSIKFAVIRRVMQLTGIRVQDSAIGQIRSAKDIVPRLVTPSKPPKLASILLANDELAAMPNVHLHDKRWTVKEKEEELGRRKLIREALAANNLPFDMKKVKQLRKN